MGNTGKSVEDLNKELLQLKEENTSLLSINTKLRDNLVATEA